MVIAEDSNNVPRLIKTDTTGHPILGAGTAEIGKLAANSGTTIGDVNVVSITGVVQTNLAKGKTILYNNVGANNSTQTIRTITAGKTYYLLSVGLTYNSGTAGASANVSTTDGVLLLMYLGATATYNTSVGDHAELTFPHPIPIAAGKTITVTSGNANSNAAGWIIGWEE